MSESYESMDQLNALRVFCQAVEQGSFAAAAQKLAISAAAVSKSVGGLEAHLGTRLFNRTTRRMSLTDAGAQYYERVTRILAELGEADEAVGALRAQARGLLRVSAPMTLSLLCLSPALPQFLARYPEISLEMQLDDRRVDIIHDGFDVALRGSDNLQDSTLIARKLMVMDHVLCAAPGYIKKFGAPPQPEALADHRCVQFSLSAHAKRWSFTKAGRTSEVPVHPQYAVNSSLAVLDALRAEYGISLVPRIYVERDLDEGRLVPVLTDWQSANKTTIYAVHPSRKHLAPKVRAFLDFLAEVFAAVGRTD